MVKMALANCKTQIKTHYHYRQHQPPVTSHYIEVKYGTKTNNPNYYH